ncbi:MAG TPA: D-amino-acid transaminase [Xanthobacteraceae bacterium]|jgi:D-alanine transaminase|nr:D-amino-acid transaminase [Xanthobacteraceae bacterium]
MSRIAYVNGRYRPHRDARVHVEDRGYQFADGVYEVCEVREARLVDERRHMARLVRSLGELRIGLPMPLSALSVVLHETVRRNRVRNGIVYVEITRGVARRDFAFPPPGTTPSIVVTARSLDSAKAENTAAEGIAVITLAETRWARPDIKSVSLLPNVLAKQAAREAGAREAWLVDAHGFVTEGASSNAWIITAGGEVVTRPADHSILSGISRAVVLDALAAKGLPFTERPFTVAEAKAAREAFITAASQIVQPVVSIDGTPVGDGRPGPLALMLRREFHRHAEFT